MEIKIDDKLSIHKPTLVSRLLAPSQSISRLQSTGNDVTGSPQDTWYWQEGGRGGWTCAISCPVANGTRRFRTFEMGWFCPLVDHAAVWKKGGVESVSFCDVDGWLSWKVRGNELMGVLWVKRIILGGSFDPSSSFFLFQKVFGGWSPKWWLFDWK